MKQASNLIGHLHHFLRHYAGALLLAVVSLVAIMVAFGHDYAVVEWLNLHRTKDVREVARAISHAGDWASLSLLTGLLLVLAFVLRERRWQRILLLMLAASVFAGVTVQPIRALTGRARPDTKIAAGWYGPGIALQHGRPKRSHSSFPSAHTTVAFAFAAPVVLYGGWVAILPLLAAATIAWSRVYLGAHYCSDVCVGALLGLVGGGLFCRSIVVQFYLGNFLAFITRLTTPRPAAAALPATS